MEGNKLVLVHWDEDAVMLLVNIDFTWFEVFGELFGIGVSLDGLHFLYFLFLGSTLDFILFKPFLKFLQLLVQQLFLGLFTSFHILVLVHVLLSETRTLDDIGLRLSDDFLF